MTLTIPVFKNHDAASAHQDMIRDLMLAASKAAKTQPRPIQIYHAPAKPKPDSVPSRIVAQMVAGQEYTCFDLRALVGGSQSAVAAALKDLRSRGLIQGEPIGTARRMSYRLVDPTQGGGHATRPNR